MVHCGRKELVNSLFRAGVSLPVRPFSRVFFVCIFSASLPNSSRLSTLSERLKQANSGETTTKRTQLSADDWRQGGKLSDYSHKITKSSKWTAVIGYAHDRATIMQ